MPVKPSGPYENTVVAVYKSREEIDKLLRIIGADSIAWMEGPHPEYPKRRLVALRFIQPVLTGDRDTRVAVRILVAVPDAGLTAKDREQAQRQYHRALYWYLKAQVEAVQFGLVQFTEAFLPHLELPGGQTVYQQIGPQYLRGAALGEITPLALLPGKE